MKRVIPMLLVGPIVLTTALLFNALWAARAHAQSETSTQPDRNAESKPAKDAASKTGDDDESLPRRHTGPGDATVIIEPAGPLTETEKLLLENIRLREQIDYLQTKLAQARLDLRKTSAQLEELRQFIKDHHELGEDFEQYQKIKELKQRELKLKQQKAAKEQREQQQAEKKARKQAVQKRRTAQQRVQQYRKAGFTPLGMDVFTSRMGFSYYTSGNQPRLIDYDPHDIDDPFEFAPTSNIDYTRMTISGSVLNAAQDVRHVGVAITFFDRHGNQIGHEIVQINNARPNVPYPFTSTIDMAANQPFASSSTYVLYADPAQQPAHQKTAQPNPSSP